jgi:hypothetical protein
MPQFTQPKALERSNNNPLTWLLLFRAHTVSSIKFYRAVSIHRSFVDLNSSFERILLEFKKSINLHLITLQILENAISKCSYARFVSLFIQRFNF